MVRKDYYEILGVARDASEDDIRRAYRRLAKEWHPDRHKGDQDAERRFKEVNEAHQVLGDKKKRAQYDQMGRAGFFGGEGAPPGGGFDPRAWETIFGGARPRGGRGGGYSYEDLGDFGDLFSQFFRGGEGGHARRGPTRGQDIRTRLRLPFELAVNGGRIAVTVPIWEPCSQCRGAGGHTETCQSCGGRGMVLSQQGGFALSHPCPECGGRGERVTSACGGCGGAGRLRREKRYQVRVPKGVSEGQVIRLAGQGQPGEHGGPAGDLLVELNIAPHDEFERQGNDVYSDAAINIAQAALGTKIEVHTVQGSVTLRVPPGTDSGAQLRLRGKGVQTADGADGDHYVRIRIETPKRLNDTQKDLLKQFAKEAGLET